MYRVSFFLIALFLFSCNSDDDAAFEEQRSEGDIFYALQVGNEWNYDYFGVDADDLLTNTGVKLNVEVTGESVIDDENLYYTLTKSVTGNTTPSNCAGCPENGVEVSRVRDSLGFLVNLDGSILFSRLGTEEILITQQPFGSIFTQLVAGNPEISVPAGTFLATDNEIFAKDPNGERFPGTYNKYYGAGIGELKETIGIISGERIFTEKQLVSYTVQ